MKRRVAVLAVSLLVGGAATARADTSQPGSYDGPLRIVAGPVLMGDQIAWAAESIRSIGNGEFTVTGRVYSAPIEGGPARRLATVARARHDPLYPSASGDAVVALAGSAGSSPG